jgi:hypothetical protein
MNHHDYHVTEMSEESRITNLTQSCEQCVIYYSGAFVFKSPVFGAPNDVPT